MRTAPRAPFVLQVLVWIAAASVVPRGACADDPSLTRRPAAVLSLVAARASMGEWNNGMKSLDALARSRGLPVSNVSEPGWTASVDVCALLPFGRNLSIGVEWDRMTGTSSFLALDATGFGGSTTYGTTADATSNAWLAVARWERADAHGPWHPFVQLGAGVGDASFDFDSPGAFARADGRGVAASSLVGVRRGHGWFQLEAGAGYRYHRVRPRYREVAAGVDPFSTFARFYFESSDDLGAFVDGRDVDLGGPFLRLGITVSPH
jgi:hypothetical protein